ncbi:LytR C-terminal domain-containing protein [Kineococcus endophyticus]|uniref:LytR C-terminal domain-containing protein n=1 Tax=Kineococcus endophyticus TaxID=1181883 RepID=A0ABV3P3Y7_9ACTN
MARERDDSSGGRDDARGDDRDDHVLPDVDDDLDVESYERLTGRRRARLVRQRIVFTVVVVLVLAVGGGAYLVYSDRWQPSRTTTPSAAPSTSCVPATPPALLTPGQVTVGVLNGTSRRGLAASVAGELRTRGFVVGTVGNAGTPTGPATAVVTYPEAAVQQAVTVAARFPEVQLVADPAATAVTVSLGDGYQQMLGEGALVTPLPPGSPTC